MKKLYLIIAILVSSCYNCFANPNNSISIGYPAVANTVISSSEYNSNNNTIQTTYNSHSHTDIGQLGTVISGTWAATPITYPFLNLTGQIKKADLATDALELAYPVGSIYISTVSTNPNTLFGFGTWTAFAAGRVLVGNGTSDAAYSAGATGGESTHTLTSTEMPAHTHTVDGYNGAASTGNIAINSDTQGTHQSVTSSSTGSSGAHNNLQPYIVVYMWVRAS